MIKTSTYNNNNNNKGLTSVSSSKDDVRDVPAAHITTNRFTQNDSQKHVLERKREEGELCSKKRNTAYFKTSSLNLTYYCKLNLISLTKSPILSFIYYFQL